MLKPGDNSPHIRRQHIFFLQSPLSLPPSGFCRQAFGKLGSGGRSESVLDQFRLVVPEDMSAHEALAPELMLPWKWWELIEMWWELLPASYIPEEKTGVLGTSPFRKSSLVREYVVGLEFGTCLRFKTGRGSDGQVIDPVQTCLTRYSSV